MRRGGMQQDVHKVLHLFQPKFVSTHSSSPFKNAKFYAEADIRSKILDARPLSWSNVLDSMPFSEKFGQIIG